MGNILERRTAPGETFDMNNSWIDDIGRSAKDLWDDTSLFGGSRPDGKGGIIKDNGILGSAFSAFDTYNRWSQGNKMYDLQSDAFDFSKDQFWNNYAQKTDLMNRERNRVNRQIAYKRNTMGMSPAERDAYYQNQSTDYYKGDRTKEVDGSYSTIGQAMPTKYAGTNTPAQSAMVGPTVNNAAPVGGPTAANAARAITPPSGTPVAAAKSAFKKPDPTKQSM